MRKLTSEEAKAIASLPRHAIRSQIIEIQRLLLKDIRSDKTSAAVRAQCVRAFDILEERLRILRGIPLPGQLRPEGKPKKRPAPEKLALPEVAA